MGNKTMEGEDINQVFDQTTRDHEDHPFELLQEISRRIDGGRKPSEAELFRDGTLAMIVKSKSFECCTELKNALKLLEEVDGPNGSRDLKFQRCRKCHGRFLFALDSGGTVTIIPGVPNGNEAYKAMSYVWGTVGTLAISCAQCGHLTLVPMMSAQRFINLMELGGAGNAIWLDALSIDQSDPEEVVATVKMMGSIYSNAKCASVLLPASDRHAFDCLRQIDACAKLILMNAESFVNNEEIYIPEVSPREPQPQEIKGEALLGTSAKLFLENLDRLRENIERFAYWRRAWTFQEWALAKDLEIGVEGGTSETLFGIKSLVLGASMLLVRYKLSYGDYAEIKSGLTRGTAPTILHVIKHQFPSEDLFLSYHEVDHKEALFQTDYVHFGMNQLLGLRDVPGATLEPRENEWSRLQARLLLLLSSFSGTYHEAKFEADLVACWASMCDLDYGYDRNESFDAALGKVLALLRSRGMTIYRFLPDTRGGEHPSSETFRDYAHEHYMLHTTNQTPYPAAPMFTGRADLYTHLAHSALKVDLPTHWNSSDDGLRQIAGAYLSRTINLDSVTAATFSEVLHGHIAEDPEGPYKWFYPSNKIAMKALEQMPVEKLAAARFCIVRIPFRKEEDPDLGGLHLTLWAVIPSDVPVEQLFVCHEPLNGTFVIATTRGGKGYIVAYLTLSDNRSGTYLVKSDETGRVDMMLHFAPRTDMGFAEYHRIGDRYLRGRVPIQTELLV